MRRLSVDGATCLKGTADMLALELKIVDRKIVEAETLVQRDAKSAAGFDKIGHVWPGTTGNLERASTSLRMGVAVAKSFSAACQSNASG